MLVPAILYEEEIKKKFSECFYSRDMMYESGGIGNWCPSIELTQNDGRYQYAIVNSEKKLIGYLDYSIDWYSSCASRFGLMSFDKGNPIVGRDLYHEMQKLIKEYHLHRIE
jgi:hypothetical protein